MAESEQTMCFLGRPLVDAAQIERLAAKKEEQNLSESMAVITERRGHRAEWGQTGAAFVAGGWIKRPTGPTDVCPPSTDDVTTFPSKTKGINALPQSKTLPTSIRSACKTVCKIWLPCTPHGHLPASVYIVRCI
jgi:hypothetical protein